MSWHFSQALVEAYSEANCSDIDVSARLKSNLTQERCCKKGKRRDCSTHSRFGMTSQPSTESDGEALLTWFQEGFLARTSARQANVLESQAQSQGYGNIWLGSSENVNQGSPSSKTAQPCEQVVLTLFCKTLPRWGTMRNGVVYPREKAARHTFVNECGYWETPRVALHLGLGLSEKALKHTAERTVNGRAESRSKAASTILDLGIGGLWKGYVASIREWLMGWPIGWNKPGVLGTDKFHLWLQEHSEYLKQDL